MFIITFYVELCETDIDCEARMVLKSDVDNHNIAGGSWVVIRGFVYDLEIVRQSHLATDIASKEYNFSPIDISLNN